MASVGPVPINTIPFIASCMFNLRSTTDYNANHGVKNILLNFINNKTTSEDGSEAWCSSILDNKQYVLLGNSDVKEIHSLSIQGRGDAPQWVTSFKLRYTIDGVNWAQFKSNGQEILTGNNDQNTVVNYVFSPPIIAKSIAIHPETWHSHISMRTEIYGRPYLCTSFVQTGSIPIGNRDLNHGKDLRKAIRSVTFDRPFPTAPKVTIGCSLVDATTDKGQMRWKINPENITATGFDVVFNTWGENTVYELIADYTAVVYI
ncbi:discoidin II [Tieghemostelium lacteum]|uniref:Discoidin II n=1 Tax=Tieghemostelium lacteum TaxID=361077 RepID=A0A151ZGC3_TIELA|nr:discoidin II [Tieghemostelium lacteum]|eukprot:KYQ93021.1 discoidin II [Tieghemostelium lacteum]